MDKALFDSLLKECIRLSLNGFKMTPSLYIRELIFLELMKSNPDAIEKHYENFQVRARKHNLRKDMTESLHDQYLFKNATKSIFNLAFWQNFRMGMINMDQVRMNIKRTIDIYKCLDKNLRMAMNEELLEFSKLQDEEYLRKHLRIPMVIESMTKNNAIPDMEANIKVMEDKIKSGRNEKNEARTKRNKDSDKDPGRVHQGEGNLRRDLRK